MDYAEYIIKAQQHIRMGYHFAETKQTIKSLEELICAVTEIRLAINALNDAKARREGEPKGYSACQEKSG